MYHLRPLVDIDVMLSQFLHTGLPHIVLDYMYYGKCVVHVIGVDVSQPLLFNVSPVRIIMHHLRNYHELKEGDLIENNRESGYRAAGLYIVNEELNVVRRCNDATWCSGMGTILPNMYSLTKYPLMYHNLGSFTNQSPDVIFVGKGSHNPRWYRNHMFIDTSKIKLYKTDPHVKHRGVRHLAFAHKGVTYRVICDSDSTRDFIIKTGFILWKHMRSSADRKTVVIYTTHLN